MAQVSLVSFVRNQLGFPGKSVNSGRGFFMCEIYEEVTWADFSDRVNVKNRQKTYHDSSRC